MAVISSLLQRVPWVLSSQCLWIRQCWVCWGPTLTKHWLHCLLAAYCSCSWERVEQVIRKVFPCHQGPKATRLSATCLTLPLSPLGSSTMTGLKLTVGISRSIFLFVITELFRRYCILQGPLETLCNLRFPEADPRSTRAKVFKLLR